MRENDNEGQGGGCDIDFASILLEIEPGYVVVEESSGGSTDPVRAATDEPWRRCSGQPRFRARW